MAAWQSRRSRRALAVITVGTLLAAIAAASCRSSAVSSRPSRTPSPAASAVAIVSPSPAPQMIPAGHVPVLMYHYIRVNPNPKDTIGSNLSVTPQNFAEQMRWAHDHGFFTISMTDLYQALVDGRPLDSHSFILTFDDGYDDLYTAALPVLRRYDLTAIAYIVPGFIGRPGYLTWDQVLKLDKVGLTIGAHTLTHPDLTRQTAAVAAAQVGGSKAELETRLAHPVDDFCYPSGRFNPAVVALVRGAGFRDATTTAFGTFESPGTALYWPRMRIAGTNTLADFAARIQNGITSYEQYGDAPPPRIFPPGL
jgi:peptidoglycan/xylan/chitin deacetylase (PgdA/CDA1 family)